MIGRGILRNMENKMTTKEEVLARLRASTRKGHRFVSAEDQIALGLSSMALETVTHALTRFKISTKGGK